VEIADRRKKRDCYGVVWCGCEKGKIEIEHWREMDVKLVRECVRVRLRVCACVCVCVVKKYYCIYILFILFYIILYYFILFY